MLKKISEKDIVYYCNAAGDAFWMDGDLVIWAEFDECGNLNDEHIPAPLRFAYNTVWGEGYGYPSYCATVSGEPVLLLVAEFGDLYLPNGVELDRDENLKELVLKKSEALAGLLDYDVLFPEDTETPFCQWEVMVAIPVTKDLNANTVAAVSRDMDMCFDEMPW